MQNGTSRQPDITGWSEGAHRNALALAEMLGVAPEVYSRDPLNLLPALQNYVDRLPLHEFEQGDWITLHTDLTSYLADILIHRCAGAWSVADDPAGPLGFRYVIEAAGRDGERHRVEPDAVVMEEFRHVPVEITRMIANAEVTLGAMPVLDD
ncbi:hypothetical protein [Streptomyces ehimensis]|uniref:Uncharacterized protein n=1 Tax=Streptomyces ehimensis TaxID=68195 RepID=A0ABV9BVC7_9ACTN